jgi:addiction module HigA family antidote
MSDRSTDPFAPVTPGDMLREEFMAEFGLSESALADVTGIDEGHIRDVIAGRARITAADAVRFGLLFGNSPEFWMNLQANHELRQARLDLAPDIAARIAAHRAA